VAWLILVLAVALPLEGAVSPGSLQLFPFLDNPVGVTGGALGWLVEAFGQVGFQLFLATLPAAALALALRFHRSRGVERQQLKWFAAAGLTWSRSRSPTPSAPRVRLQPPDRAAQHLAAVCRHRAVVDRRFNRRRYDAAATIQGFAARLRRQLDLDALSNELLAVVDQTMEPTWTSLWLRPAQQPS